MTKNPTPCQRDLSHAFGLAMRLEAVPAQIKSNIEPLLIEFDLHQEARVNLRNVLGLARHLDEILKALSQHFKESLEKEETL